MDVLIGWPGGDLTATLKLVGIVVFGYVFVLWVASVLWSYKDIRARTRDPIAQAIGVGVAAFFPIVGLPVYLVLRPGETLAEAYARQLEQEAILSDLHSISSCPNCRRPVEEDFQVCAHCATPLRQPCPRCDRLLQFSWRHCPYCATARETARQPRTATAAAAAAGSGRPRTESASARGGRPVRGATAPPRPVVDDPDELESGSAPARSRATGAAGASGATGAEDRVNR